MTEMEIKEMGTMAATTAGEPTVVHTGIMLRRLLVHLQNQFSSSGSERENQLQYQC